MGVSMRAIDKMQKGAPDFPHPLTFREKSQRLGRAEQIPTNCKNCGAIVNKKFNRCDYCNTQY